MNKKDNRGFSLIELIVTIAIMAIAMGALAYSLHLISSTRAKTTAEKVKTALENTRMQTMACGGGYVEFSRDANGDLYVLQSINNGAGGGSQAITNEKIGSSAIKFTYAGATGAATELTSGNSVRFAFNAGTGAFTTGAIKTIVVSGAGKTYTITCYQLTGKVSME